MYHPSDIYFPDIHSPQSPSDPERDVRHPQRRPRPPGRFAQHQRQGDIDLSLPNSVRFDSASKTVSFGPGVRWKHVYAEAQKNGRVVAGLLLGGGSTWMTARKGCACDNVVAFEVVLADGLIVTADTNADLFRALKGGCNNFENMIGFTMSATPYERVWSSSTASPKEYVVAGAALVETRGAEIAAAFAEWSKLPKIIDKTGIKSMMEMGLDTALRNDHHRRGRDMLVEELKSYVPDDSFTTRCIFQPLPLVFTRHSAAASGNVLGLERNHP
ncbi:hypothetical protein DL771_002730 [Monosporascus sp. 5C6A]|nr:hypothetical protein DL771_002730 [Monosporascus sp. 5C6A]